jgi:hypothetical protein
MARQTVLVTRSEYEKHREHIARNHDGMTMSLHLRNLMLRDMDESREAKEIRKRME